MVETELEVPTHRKRLLEGMAHAVAAKGYADTTISDIVREASVSRRTFYEHFQTKAQCLLALYEAASHNMLKVLRDALGEEREWQEQLDNALSAYLRGMAENPVLLRTLYIDILGLGPEGLAVRRRVNEEVAEFILAVINRGRADGESSRALTAEMAMAIVGGINELILQMIEEDRVAHLQDLVRPASQLVRAVTQQR